MIDIQCLVELEFYKEKHIQFYNKGVGAGIYQFHFNSLSIESISDLSRPTPILASFLATILFPSKAITVGTAGIANLSHIGFSSSFSLISIFLYFDSADSKTGLNLLQKGHQSA